MSHERLDTLTVADLSLEVSRRSSLSREVPTIPGYELDELLGQGAFGQVYKAVQKSTGQEVAVKVLYSVSGGFREEVTRLSRVSDHPNIVTLVDANLDHDPPYLVTPYLPRTLRDRIPDTPAQVDSARVVRWFEEIARALQFVHGRGILHCDLKPANILLGEEEQARLVDFGQSVALDGKEFRLGSFWYMPWQQARLPGEGAEIPDVSWDLYALGATIYVLLSGELPRASEASSQSLSELQTGQEKVERYRELVKTTPLKPLRELNPGLDRDLAAIVEGCLRLGDPVYGSAGEVLEDLTRWKEQRPVKARGQSGPYWLERFVARNRLSVLIAGLAGLVVLAGLSWSSLEIYQARQARRALLVAQYERGLSLLERGRASGLVWLARACEQAPSESSREGLQKALAGQLRVADPRLYRRATSTAPSPSGTRVIAKDLEDRHKRVLLDLTTGQASPIPDEILGLDQNQKDTVRYRLDGVVLDPLEGRGGPATWRLPPFDSVSPANQDAPLALLIRPDLVLQVRGKEEGFEVTDSGGSVIFVARGPRFSGAPTFSLQGDLVVGWEDDRVELYSRRAQWKPRVLDPDFAGELFCFSPDGQRLAGHDGDNRVKVWDLSGKVLTELELTGTANEMAFDEHGELLVCATREATVEGFQIATGQPAWAPAELEKSARWVFVQPGGRVVTMSDEVTVWDPPPTEHEPSQPLEVLLPRVPRWTGWVYDENARVRTLTRSEYRARF